MKKSVLFMALALTSSVFAAEKTVYVDYQCSALGNNFRVMFADRAEYLVESRIAFGLKLDEKLKDQAGEAKLSYIGHVAFAKFVENHAKQIDLFDGYGHLLGEKANVLSPRARKYKDHSYLRFTEISDVAQTSHDGGGLNGYLVVSKKALGAKSGESFDAHLVFQHGDHTGGTLDYTCKKE